MKTYLIISFIFLLSTLNAQWKPKTDTVIFLGERELRLPNYGDTLDDIYLIKDTTMLKYWLIGERHIGVLEVMRDDEKKLNYVEYELTNLNCDSINIYDPGDARLIGRELLFKYKAIRKDTD